MCLQVCKHFLYAIEKGVYGWFWECPSGGDKCIYRHALPPGFVLKRDKEEEKVEETATITLEELVEREVRVGSGGIVRHQLIFCEGILLRVTPVH